MYDEKDTNYFSNLRKELLDLIPIENKNGELLEIGAGNGSTLLYAKKNGYAKRVFGIELCEINNSHQTSELFSGFLIGNVEIMELPYQDNQFDVIICGDVLEHLINPYELLVKLKRFLSPNGVIIASIPNIREWNSMKDIFFRGDFNYQVGGVLDKTHLRFFCKKNIKELFETNGYDIKALTSSNIISRKKYCRQFRLLKLLRVLLLEEFFTEQYFVVARPRT